MKQAVSTEEEIGIRKSRVGNISTYKRDIWSTELLFVILNQTGNNVDPKVSHSLHWHLSHPVEVAAWRVYYALNL